MEEKKAERQRHCPRCLTRDMDQAAYFANLHTYIANLEPEIKADEALYQERLSVCRACPLLTDAMCRACGCFVELRAAIAANRCPYEKWQAAAAGAPSAPPLPAPPPERF